MIVIEGGPREFSMLAFGEPHQGTLNFLEQGVNQLSDRLTDAGRAFMERGRVLFNQYHGAEALQRARAALRTVQYAFYADMIRPLGDIAAIQQAPPSMQRWIMAFPEVRELYHQQRMDGYSNTYVDYEPNQVGVNHSDWRTLMSGVVQDCEDDENADFKYTVYVSDDPDEVKLSLHDKNVVFSVWDLLQAMDKSAGKEDPTSVYCSKM